MFFNQIDQVLQKGQVRVPETETDEQVINMRNFMKVAVKGKDRSKWKEVISAYPNI
jgi:hypothetical protein